MPELASGRYQSGDCVLEIRDDVLHEPLSAGVQEVSMWTTIRINGKYEFVFKGDRFMGDGTIEPPTFLYGGVEWL